VLRQIAEGVLIHESEFCQSNAVVVQGRDGVLLIDPALVPWPGTAREDGGLALCGVSCTPSMESLLCRGEVRR